MQKNQNKKYTLFLFDLDGTLLDTAREFHTALNEILDKEKRPHQSFDNVREKVSDGAGALVSLGFDINEQNVDFENKRIKPWSWWIITLFFLNSNSQKLLIKK